jgi:hypothetical protein
VSCLSFCTRQEADINAVGVETAAGETPKQAGSVHEPEETAGNVDFSDAYYNIPIKETPEYHSFIYRYERMREEQLALLEESMRQYGLTADIKDSQSLNSAGYGLYEKKKYAEAVRFFREAAYTDITNVYAHYNLACSLSLLKDDLSKKFGRRKDLLGNGEAEALVKTYKLYNDIFEFEYGPVNENHAEVMIYDELYDHLTLAVLQSEVYISKSQEDEDLKFVQKQQRFNNLLGNIQTGKLNALYGRWFTNDIWEPVFYCMMDQRICSVFYNNAYLDFYVLSYFENTSLADVDKRDYTPDPSDELGYTIGSNDSRFTLYDLQGGSLLFTLGENRMEAPAYTAITHTEVYTVSLPYKMHNSYEMSWNDTFDLIRFDNPYIGSFVKPKTGEERLSMRTLISLFRMMSIQNNVVGLQNMLEYADNPKELIDHSGAILYAAYGGCEASLRFLLKNNADINVQANIQTRNYNFLAFSVGHGFFYELYDEYKDALAVTSAQKRAITEMALQQSHGLNQGVRKEIQDRLGF